MPREPTPASDSLSSDRAVFLAVALVTAGVLAIARFLVSPDPRGFGTHQQLGLPPCFFRELTSLPCPACGLTTAFAHMVRGQWAGALAANPFGVILCAVAGLTLPLSLGAALRGASLQATLARLHAPRVSLALVAFCLVFWLARVCAILLG